MSVETNLEVLSVDVLLENKYTTIYIFDDNIVSITHHVSKMTRFSKGNVDSTIIIEMVDLHSSEHFVKYYDIKECTNIVYKNHNEVLLNNFFSSYESQFKIFVLMGRSNSGKDSIYNKLKEVKTIMEKCNFVVMCTTRPIRSGEIDGESYHFKKKNEYDRMVKQNIIFDSRSYEVLLDDNNKDVWVYFLTTSHFINCAQNNHIVISTPEGYSNIVREFGQDHVIPILISCDESELLERAICRAKEKSESLVEVCRRFISDTKDFSTLDNIGEVKEFKNENGCLDKTVEEVANFIIDECKGEE